MLWWGISSRWVSTRLFGYQRKEGLPSAASENTLEFSSIWRTSSFVSTWDLNSVLNRCSLGLLRAQCYHCPPFSLLIPHIYLPVCQSSEVSWFLVFRWIILCTLVTSPCVVSLKFLLKKKKKGKNNFSLAFVFSLKGPFCSTPFQLCLSTTSTHIYFSFMPDSKSSQGSAFIFHIQKKHPSLLHIIE